MKLVSISSETKNLLDRLYNLRGKDSVLLTKMEEDKKQAIATEKRAKKEKEELLKQIENLTHEEEVLAEQGNKLISVLNNINRKDFEMVLERLNIDFQPEKLNEKLNTLLPETIDTVVAENERTSLELQSVEDEMNNAQTLIEELEIRKEEALVNQEKLNEYIELALSGSINITRDEIINLIEKFEFNESEQREAAKILMFPEDALYEYDARIKNGDKIATKSMKEIFEETKVLGEENNGETSKKEEIVEEVKAEDLELEEIFDDIVSNIQDSEELIIDHKENVLEEKMIDEKQEEMLAEETVEEQVVIEPVTDVSKKLSDLSIDINKMDEKAKEKIIANFDEELVKNNVETFKENELDINIFITNSELLYDKDLKEKLKKLLEVGKKPEDISLVPSVLVKYDLTGLTNTINVLQISGLDPKKVPLMAY